MSDFIRTLRTDQTTYFSMLPKDIIDLVAERVPRVVYEGEKEKLIKREKERQTSEDTGCVIS